MKYVSRIRVLSICEFVGVVKKKNRPFENEENANKIFYKKKRRLITIYCIIN